MSRQIEQALFSLMPTYGSDLPPPLVELAESLVSQSRFKASTLKAEEEVGRLYACANLACNRLKVTLDLPPIQARPPIPPRIYNRLYTHLDNIIPAPSSTPRRGRPPRTTNSKGADLASETRPIPSRATPTKEQSLARFRTPTKGGAGTPSKSTGAANSLTGGALPVWVKPVIRSICSETGQLAIAPTINIAPILSAIYFYVTIKLVALSTGQPMTKEPFSAQRREILKLLGRAREETTVNVPSGQDPWAEWEDTKPRDFNSAVNQMEEQGWLDSDWFKGLDELVGAKRWDVVASPAEDEDDMAKPIQIRRADTMFQEKYNYLSEERKADYNVWRHKMLQRITDNRTNSGAMEIDTQ
uniref:ORC6 first cyclin-like domain-containing protein n=1 Tax=Bionectria ochroleuca TaxID=29856 RepID=A0A0B7JT86_BIOOC